MKTTQFSSSILSVQSSAFEVLPQPAPSVRHSRSWLLLLPLLFLAQAAVCYGGTDPISNWETALSSDGWSVCTWGTQGDTTLAFGATGGVTRGVGCAETRKSMNHLDTGGKTWGWNILFANWATGSSLTKAEFWDAVHTSGMRLQFDVTYDPADLLDNGGAKWFDSHIILLIGTPGGQVQRQWESLAPWDGLSRQQSHVTVDVTQIRAALDAVISSASGINYILMALGWQAGPGWDGIGVVSYDDLKLTTIPLPPAIVRQPLTQTAELGSLAGFRVWLTNALPGTVCQWYFNGTPLAGATNTSLKLTDAQPAQIGTYTVVVSNACGAVTSTPAMLNVIPVVPRRTVAAVYLTGDLGSLLHLDYSGTLAPNPAWQTLANLTLTNPPQLCLDLTDPMPPARFYRVWQAGTPSVLPAADLELATELTLTGTPGTSLRVDYINRYGPTDAWVTLATVPLTSASQTYVDLTMIHQPPRLYRLVPVP